VAQYKEFTTAAEEKVEGGLAQITFKIDGHELTAHPPRDGQVAMMMAQMGRHSTNNDKVSGMIDFFVNLFDPADEQYLVNRLWDREDDFGIEQISDVMTWLMEEWSKRPTK
jgi:uncharacterized protein YneF (UPF0154 family)